MSQWYLSKEGKALGPLSEDKIIDMIQAGRATHLDLVYRSGDSSWLPISQVNPFAQYFNQQEPVAQAQEGEPEWVLLKRVESEEGSQFKQIGPFAQSEVLRLIDQGEIRFSDFAWKTGMDNWSKISELEVFAQPLPSTPRIDKGLYESTQSKSLDTETLTDNKAREGLSEMVKIEHYDSEKTVVTRTQNNIPLNNEDFVTELDLSTGTTDGVSSQSDVDLWSLEPPKKPVAGRSEPNKIQTGTSAYERKLKAASEHRKKSSSSKKKKKKKRSPSPTFKERLQLGIALAAMFLAFIFFYKSLKTPSADRRLDALVADEAPLNTETYQDNQNLSFGSQNQNLEIQPTRQASAPIPAPARVSSPQKNREREGKSASQASGDKKLRSRPAVQASAAPSPPPTIKKLPVAGDKQPEVKPAPQVATTNPVKVKKALVPPPKNKPALRGKSVSVPKSTGTQSPNPVGRSLSSGSAKSQSFYKQRDRKALFYSSLRAETLAAEIENQYQKLHKNKTAWSRYYAQWRKKAQSSLAKDIQNYPIKQETYAYPQLMAEFKKDFNLIFKYGETFDHKVKGGRVPSDAPQDVRQIFAQHRKKAQSLGL
jgi:hypothetical protein